MHRRRDEPDVRLSNQPKLSKAAQDGVEEVRLVGRRAGQQVPLPGDDLQLADIDGLPVVLE